MNTAVHWKGPVQAKNLTLLRPGLSFARHFSRTATTNLVSRRQLLSQRPTSCLHSSWRPRSCFEPPRISFVSSTRLQSTVADVPNPPVNAASPEAGLGDTFSFSTLDSATRLSTEDLASIPVPEQIGYLKALGLDFGWGPTSMMQWLLEHIHVWTGAPWWLSIGLTAVVLRAVFFKAFIGSADTSGRMAALRPATQPLLDKMREAQKQRDTPAILRIKGEMNSIFTRAGVQTWKAFIPALQIPLGFGSFRLLKNMAILPVPGLDNGGILWFRDLTIPDPWLGLPLLTGLMLYRNMKSNEESGAATLLSPRMMKVLTYGLPALTTFVTLNWPAAVQLTFFFSTILAMLQSFAFRQPRFRRWVGIVPIPRPPPPPSTVTASPYPGKINLSARYQAPKTAAVAEKLPKPEGIIGGAIAEVRGMGIEMQKSWKKLKGEEAPNKPGERTESEKRQAEAYEKKRQRELKQQRQEIEQKIRENWWVKQEQGVDNGSDVKKSK